MTTARIVYASMTGNNEEIAGIVEEAFQDLEIDVETTEISQADAADYQKADICVLVTYTYGEGDMPDEAQDFYDDLLEEDLTGKIYGTCGSGDRFYEGHFCATVDDFDKAFAQTGATKGADSVKVDLAAEADDIANLEAFVQKLVTAATNR
ncbi:flavodoxin [Lapidilactobacillus gannanensis]|jgi:flavodoxin short chain|uniref:Flavodoxin n=1 Tax=Lapidilactobacillus gannanensis TaxID=2486002 RepID=A0ABW4BLI1_9LACO|nr:flavodoxin [Lapidilactobacillus gannanensis]MCH4057237.1 flavodoxin [Lactobacillaceae bacterium]